MSMRWLVVCVMLVTLLSSTLTGCTRPTGPKRGLSTTTGN